MMNRSLTMIKTAQFKDKLTLEIALLYLKGLDVFVDSQKFNTWLESQNIALGGIKPKDLLDNTFGINMIKDELSRIEHGVLA